MRITEWSKACVALQINTNMKAELVCIRPSKCPRPCLLRATQTDITTFVFSGLDALGYSQCDALASLVPVHIPSDLSRVLRPCERL